MKTVLVVALVGLLLVVCWPLALVLLVVAPVLWLLSLPFLLVGMLLSALLALAGAVLMLPARLLGHRG